MFKTELINFLLSSEKASMSNSLDEWYLSDFYDKHIHNIGYEEGYVMLVDCCDVWMKYPNFTFELVDIMSSIRNRISTNTFPQCFNDSEEQILEIYLNTDNRVSEIIYSVYKNIDIDNDMLDGWVQTGIEDEKKMLKELFQNSNIKILESY